jgi:pimeloyl-ACP methyl ester carboxylesterase
MPFIQFNHKKIFYRLEGEGKPVLFLHGFGENGNIWNGQINALKEKYLLIVPDLPGSGDSEILEGEVSLEDYAEVIKAIYDEVISKDQQEICMIGHSMGGYITLAFAEKYSNLLNSFGLFHSSAFADDADKISTRKKGIEFITKHGSDPFLKSSIPNLFSEQTKKEKPQLITQLFELAKNISPTALIQYYQAMMRRPNRVAVLESFKKPVLFIIGKNDQAVPLQSSLEQCSVPEISTVHILQNSGHMGMWEEEQSSNVYLLSFLKNFV